MRVDFVSPLVLCPKNAKISFVKARRLWRIRHRDFCGEQRERHGDFGESDREVYVALIQVTLGVRLSRVLLLDTPACASEHLLIFFFQPFFGGPHRNLCTRGKA
jgi:hypothetical protein